MITSPAAAAKMTAYVERTSGGVAAFASKAQISERTFRSFRASGRIRKDLLSGIAKAMKISTEDLLRE